VTLRVSKRVLSDFTKYGCFKKEMITWEQELNELSAKNETCLSKSSQT
jgi:hypothetical protein